MDMTIQDFENLPAEEQMELYETVRQSIDRRCHSILKDVMGIDATSILNVFTRRSRTADIICHPDFIKDGEIVVDVCYIMPEVDENDSTEYTFYGKESFPLRWLDKDCDYMKEIKENR
ncbi:MAG: hypothetical protein IKE23_12560 [Exiguobacterium sp.]|nr:hypothetical protein [Exiguobacterium sp.]